ncbi:hypothetical protein FEP39_02982 [Burkholderia multivorans]|nr:hypothetical protein [Burkholderia multivorans]MDR9051745.1 hypothetical protein [Burkholderia multivorans]MDR9057717.1 hypothetical protein [Burkholderia multivorans]MDR9064628.1 hypothetical protein [Burkholderia multivorans]MDR9069761.1 hypothetical protein [Burkholderia multivorans]MDR9076841.1 hypothetical protein [Burkholderia multivorans]
MNDQQQSRAAVRVCSIADAECSRGCGTGACKREQPAAAPTRCYQCGGCGDNDVAPGHCVRCNGSGIEPHPVEQPAAAPLTMTLNPAAPPLTMAPSPADERAAFESLKGAWQSMPPFDVFCAGWQAARAASANETGAEGEEPVAVPSGWKLVRVNEHFDALIAALERAESKGYLPETMREEWENFAYDENVTASPPPAQAAEQVAQWQSRLKDRSSPVVDRWVNISPDGAKTLMEKYANVYEVRALYAAPQPSAQAGAREGLTDERIAHIAAAHTNSVVEFDRLLKFARALLKGADHAE